MRYVSANDSRFIRKKALGPALQAARLRTGLPVPGRGTEYANIPRVTLRGFGATSANASIWSGPPVGAGSGKGAEIGAEQGASLGTQIAPGIGTAIGAVVGAIGGAIAGAIHKTDPEVGNFNAAVSLWQSNPDQVYYIADKYLVLAGLFDLSLNNPHIPIYQKFGRMGEQKFTQWLIQTVYNAAMNGQISSNDTAFTIMSRIVQPAINAWGYAPMNDPHGDLINRIMIGMIWDYITANTGAWRAVGGDLPNWSPPFPVSAVVQIPSSSQTGSATPSPITTPAPGAAVNVTATPLVSTPTTQSPPAPPTLLTAAWSTVTPGQNAALQTYQGVFYFGPPNAAGVAEVYIATGAGVAGPDSYNAGVGMLLTANNLVYLKNAAGQWFYYTGTAWSATTAPTIPATAQPSTTTQPPAVGAPISSALDATTGQMLGLPAGGTYGGLTPQGAWIINYGSNAYLLQNGVLVPYTTATAGTGTASAGTSVSTVPPAIGTAIAYVKDNSTGQMVAVPAGGTYAGLTSTGGWLITYPAGGNTPAGTYASNNGQLTLQTSAGAAGGIPAGYSATGQSVLVSGQAYPLYADANGNTYIWYGGTMQPYSTTGGTAASTTSASGGGGYYPTGGGGGGGYYSNPTPNSTPDVIPAVTGANDNTLLFVGLAAVGAFLFMES